MASPLDPKVVGIGAALEIAIVVPAALIVRALRQDDMAAESNLWLVASFLALVVGPAAAGWLVGRKRPDTPALHAAAATGAAWVVFTVMRLGRAALGSQEVAPLLATLLTIVPIQVGVGVLFAIFSRPRSKPEADDAPPPVTTEAGDSHE